MRTFHLEKNHSFAPIINVEKLWSLVPEDVRHQYAKSDKAIVIDCVKNVSVSFLSTIEYAFKSDQFKKKLSCCA